MPTGPCNVLIPLNKADYSLGIVDMSAKVAHRYAVCKTLLNGDTGRLTCGLLSESESCVCAVSRAVEVTQSL